MTAGNSTTCTILIVSPSPSLTLRGADQPQVFKPFSWARWFPSLIATFPTRLLGEIFWYILFNLDGTPAKNIEVNRTLLRSTCRHWMNAVDSNSFLWTALVLEPFDLWYKDYNVAPNLVDRFVRCSGEEPLSIRIDASLDRFPHYRQPYANLIMQSILIQLVGLQGDVLRRWTFFKFTCCDLINVSLSGALSAWPAPLLLGVEVNCPGPCGEIVELNAPILRWIIHRESTLFFAPPRGFLFMALTDLTLWAPSGFETGMVIDLYGWLNILRQTPRLVCLRLCIFFAVDNLLPGPLEKEEIIELSYLQHLLVHEEGPWKFLQYLRFPALATMKVDGQMCETLCDRLMKSAQCYEHLSHLKRLWFRRGIATTTPFTVKKGESCYGQFLARLFPDLDSLILPFYTYEYSSQEAPAFLNVWPLGDRWRSKVLVRIRDDIRFPNRAVINGCQDVFKRFFEYPYGAPPGLIEAHRKASLELRRS
jgi:hypothetical protein